MSSVRFVAIGDSFTEGVGDDLPDGHVRGWADLVAQGWADGSGESVSYANLAIRGRLVWPIVEEQLDAALALAPTHLSFNGGGNDILRPRASVSRIADAFTEVLRRCDDQGVTLLLLSGANPSGQLPLGRVFQRRGDLLSAAVEARIANRPDVVRAYNWPDRELGRPPYWSPDRLHMNARGHHRVAARVLAALGQPVPDGWWSLPELPPADSPRGRAYYREHVGPWIRRRLTGTSSGDGREAKYAAWRRSSPLPAEAAQHPVSRPSAQKRRALSTRRRECPRRAEWLGRDSILPGKRRVMSIGSGIALFVIGAILAFAVNVQVEWVDLDLIGYILMGAGALVFLIGIILMARRRQSDTVTRTSVDPVAGERVTRQSSSTTPDDRAV